MTTEEIVQNYQVKLQFVIKYPNVISPKSFNLITKMPIVLPITSGGNFARNMGFAVELIGGKTTGIVRCDQSRALDFEARHARFLESSHADVLDEVLARYIAIFSPED